MHTEAKYEEAKEKQYRLKHNRQTGRDRGPIVSDYVSENRDKGFSINYQSY
jgi:hypothetical protein